MKKSERIQVITEIVSALAVIVTLVFLIIEIRLNTEQTTLNVRAVEADAYQGLIAQMTHINKRGLDYPEFQDIWRRWQQGDSNLPREEYGQVNSYLWMIIRHADLAYYQYERGIIDEERFLAVITVLTGPLKASVRVREEWDRRKLNLVQGFKDTIDNYIEEWKLANPEAIAEQEKIVRTLPTEKAHE